MSEGRAEIEQRRRRRRSNSYQGSDLRLDVPQALRNPDYVYGWLNDEKGKLQRRTLEDDWDFVTKDELNIPSHDDYGFNAKNNSETDNRIRREVDSGTSSRPIFAYLVKKRREFHEEDQRELTKRNIDLRRSLIMTQRAPGALDSAQDNEEFAEHSYVPGNVREAIRTTEQRIRRAGGWPKGKPRGPRTTDPYEQGDRG